MMGRSIGLAENQRRVSNGFVYTARPQVANKLESKKGWSVQNELNQKSQMRMEKYRAKVDRKQQKVYPSWFSSLWIWHDESTSRHR